MTHHSDSSSCCCGHAKSCAGKGHALAGWMRLRISAVLSLPLIIWVIYSILSVQALDHAAFTAWLSMPLNAGLLAAFVVINCYHGALGVQEIIEDYVSCQKSQKCAIFAEKILFAIVAAASLWAIAAIAL
ncbi:MAG: succinate dehydrogenase, hydrophobic membrane anchor protein [Micavibrio aeruginosavorus]|uniref:Succinate dehydrogenase hydrophobic membrane anchor subunit n=1 Tax=Micavibrio aeruginosavorus TaxID=349221 RepID=A0A2W4ZZX5_9BACT|nr:MAG: succinate dehydrogenase, hydrophobic membrane anchor protein [Micavibrio aeruginosavorus]